MRLFKRKPKTQPHAIMYSRLSRRIPVRAGNLGTQMGFGVTIIVRRPRKIEVKYYE